MKDLKYDLIYEMASDDLIPLSEVSFFISPRVNKHIRETPKVKKKEFVDEIRKGDIIVAFSAKKQFMKTKMAKFMAKLLATAQASPYSSAKFAIEDNMVAGYGIQVISRPGENKITKKNTRDFVTARSEMMLLRISNITKQQIDDAANFIIKRIGTKYSGSDLYKTSWNRLTNRRLFSFLKNKPLTPEEVNLIQEPLFCSNLISLALVSAGYKKRFNNQNPWDAWPRDFIVSDLTDKICRIDHNKTGA
jgi:hypothetical protein